MRDCELESIEELDSFLRDPKRDWAGVSLQGLDLKEADIDARLLQETIAPTTVFLGCRMTSRLIERAYSFGAYLFPPRQGLKFDPFRGAIYSASELLANYDRHNPSTYFRTTDWEAYKAAMDEQTKRKRTDIGVGEAVFFRLHDFSIGDALDDYLRPDPTNESTWKKAVAITGGHDLPRLEKVRDLNDTPTPDDAPYMRVVLLAWKLAQEGFTVVTGGGPGAMEAGNLGAWFASRSESELRMAVKLLERVPKVGSFAQDGTRWNSGEWLDPAFEVIEKFPRDNADTRSESVGIPTWFYGHEPPNPFASHIAKYFENSIREEGLLEVANCGVIVAEGNAGTVQEIFQDACQNYYKTYGGPAPMVLFGSRYWNRSGFGPVDPRHKPVWPLLQQLASEKRFERLLKLTDRVDEAVAFISNPPSE